MPPEELTREQLLAKVPEQGRKLVTQWTKDEKTVYVYQNTKERSEGFGLYYFLTEYPAAETMIDGYGVECPLIGFHLSWKKH